MRQAGVTEAPARERRTRAWVDFGVDETWEPARPTRTRRERSVDSWVDDADLFAPRYEDDVAPARRPAHDEDDVAPMRRLVRDGGAGPRLDDWAFGGASAVPTVALRPDAAPRRPRAERSRRAPADLGRVEPAWHEHPDAAQDSSVPVSVDILDHPAQVPVAHPAPESNDPVAHDTASGERMAGSGVPGRRTVTIRGRGAERDLAFPEPGRARRPAVRRHERPGFKPDRTALWALLLGVVLVLVAATSSHAAVLRQAHAVARPAPRVAHVAHAPTGHGLVVRVQR